jgi:predicted DNA-binding transcriptional regulator AlpA
MTNIARPGPRANAPNSGREIFTMAITKPGQEYLRVAQQAEYLGVHPKTIGRIAQSDPTFPAEVSISGGSHGVRVRARREIDAWVASKRPRPPEGATVTPIQSAKKRGRPRKTAPMELG